VRLPIPKMMEYQLADGAHVRELRATGPSSDRAARCRHRAGGRAGPALRAHHQGHRFQSSGELQVPDANAYVHVLEREGRVLPDFDTRRARIRAMLSDQAALLQASMGDETQVEPLLDEVTALVEWPAVYVGEFEAVFLQVPQECLILTMRTNQKYFPLFDAQAGCCRAF
jgi:glycyl-tRNA synthetase beta chain